MGTRAKKLREARHTHRGQPPACPNMCDDRKRDRDDCVFYGMCRDDAAFSNESKVCREQCPPGRWYAPRQEP